MGKKKQKQKQKEKKVETTIKEKQKKVELTVDEFLQGESKVLWEIIDFSSNIPITLYGNTLGIKIPESRYRGLFFGNESLCSEDYLLNFKKSTIDMSVPLGVSSYSSFAVRGSVSIRQYLERTVEEDPDLVIKLPPYKKVNAPLTSVIRSRRSIREYTGEKLSLEDLSTILYHANGISGNFDLTGGKDNLPKTISLGDTYINKLRNAPSGGGLFPINLYILCQNVEKLENGIYLYQPISHTLMLVKKIEDDDLGLLPNIADSGPDIDVKKINVYFFYVYNLFYNTRKYNDMALSFAYIEVGEISQNIHLVCTALALGPCDIGGFNKVFCENLLGLDGLSKHMIHLTILGV